MAKHLLIVLALLPLSAFGQAVTEVPKTHGFLLGLCFSPDYAHRATISDADLIEKILDDADIPKIGFTAGVSMVFDFGERFSLESGIQYSQKGFRTKEKEFKAPQPDPSLPVSGWFVYESPYIDVPLKLNWRPFEGERFFFSGGLVGHLYLQSNTKSVNVFSDGRKEEKVEPSTDESFKKFTLGAMAGFGMEWNVSAYSRLRVEPLFRHMVMPTSDGGIKYYLWSAGLNVGFYSRLD